MSSKEQLKSYNKRLNQTIRDKDAQIQQLTSTLRSVNYELQQLRRVVKNQKKTWIQRLLKL